MRPPFGVVFFYPSAACDKIGKSFQMREVFKDVSL